jgi:hypothetical protein
MGARKRLAGAFSVVLLLLVTSPVAENWKDTPEDDFPLSYYPMFSTDRADRQRVTYLVRRDAAGGGTLLPYWYAGAGGMNQVRRQITKLANDGGAQRLCRKVAARAAQDGGGPGTIEVVTGTFRLSAFFAGDRLPASEAVRARCPVR